jgi:hypothetical protein
MGINGGLPFLNMDLIFYKIFYFLANINPASIYQSFLDFSLLITPYSIAISFLLSVGFVYCYMRVGKIEGEMFAELHAHGHGHEHGGHGDHHDEAEDGHDTHHDSHGHGDHEGEHRTIDEPNKRWVRVTEHINSENESDWRLAILEADLILEDILNKIGYKGENIGDKLKNVEKSDFHTLDLAWEAHKVRNQIAHAGGDFRIDKKEAKRIISLYEEVFKEFHFI